MNFTEKEELRLELQPGDLLTCEGGDIGRTALWAGNVERCYYQNHLHRLRSENGRADPQFAVFWFWYSFNIAKLYFGRGNDTTIPNLSRSKLAELPMPLPPIPEQKKIAQILSTVQRSIEAQERIIQATNELKKALMHKLPNIATKPKNKPIVDGYPELGGSGIGALGKCITGSTPKTKVPEFTNLQARILSPHRPWCTSLYLQL